MTLSVLDGYCGAGGSSSGAEMVPGVRVRYALNHWDKAIATHNHNMPHVDHDRVDMTDQVGGNPRKYAATDLGWFSPECTTWSSARGERCDYDARARQRDLDRDDEEGPVPDEATQRSRFQMQTVPLFAAVHRYKAVIVENVTDILKWWALDRWLSEMRSLGYRHRIVVLNSAFAHQLGAPAPQLRDRAYFVFWQDRYRTPDFDKWTRPRAWCPRCQTVVRALYVEKPGKPRAMRYGQQYRYRCPQASCRGGAVHPYVLPAAAAIDWTLPAQRIGDRRDPLKPKTLARIAAGLRRYAHPTHLDGVSPAAPALTCPPLLVPSGGTWNTDATPLGEPMRTRTTPETEAALVPPFLLPLRSGRPRSVLATQPLATVVADGSNHALVEALLVPTEGRDGIAASPASRPHRTQTGRHETALVVPLRNNGVARPAGDHPAPAFAAAGTHHALVMRNNTASGDQGQMSTPPTEPLRTLLAERRHSLIQWAGHLVYGYDTGLLRPLGQPLPTQTAIQGDALLGSAVTVEDCTFRMLDVHEIKAGMAFATTFAMPVGAKRDKVRMLGNAVTPPAARDLIAAIVEAITGDPIEEAG
jgi:DNA (cytosine-5)-methyltransferase 1